MKTRKIITILIFISIIFTIIVLHSKQINQITNPKLHENKQFQDKSTEIILSKDNNWKKQLNLDKYDENGKIILYEIDEKHVPTGYTKHIKGTKITNTIEEYTYCIEYYFDEIKNEELTKYSKAPYKQEISTYMDQIVDNQDYKLDRVENLGIKISSDETKNIIKVYYTSNKAETSKGILEKHINTITNELLEKPILHKGNKGESYNIKPKEFKNFEVDTEKIPQNNTGIIDENLIEVIYYYKPKSRTNKN